MISAPNKKTPRFVGWQDLRYKRILRNEALGLGVKWWKFLRKWSVGEVIFSPKN